MEFEEQWQQSRDVPRQEETTAREARKKMFPKVIFSILGACCVTLITYWVFFSGPTEVAYNPPPVPVQTAQATVKLLPVNTSEDCTGRISDIETIGIEEKKFNPKGCNYYYTAASSGVVIFKGPLGTTRRVDLAAKTQVIPWVAYSVHAESGTAVWQYFLCAGMKEHMDKLDCS